jgi:galactose-1-phosphate uridylyltransferase
MKKNLLIASALVAAIATQGVAKPNAVKDPEAFQKLMKMGGETSPYYRAQKEDFLKDYFLVSQNLPFLVGTALYHPNSDTLKLSKEQLDKLQNMAKTIVPVSAKMAKEVKTMELQLAKAVVEEGKDPKSQEELVKKIADAKEKMTMAHLDCIHAVQSLLSKEQFATLLKLASRKQ